MDDSADTTGTPSKSDAANAAVSLTEHGLYSAVDRPASHSRLQSNQRRPWKFYVVAALLLAAVPIARWFLFEIDHQFANLAGAGLIALAFLTAYIGLWRSMATSVARKMLWLISPLVMLGIACVVFEFVGFTGETLPVFRLRNWQGKAILERTESSKSNRSNPSSSRASSQFRSTQFLGTDRNGIIQSPEFGTAWDQRLPSVVWRKPIGAGWSSFAVDAGLAITMEQIDEHECVTAFELESGAVVWQFKLPGRHYHPMGGLGPRSTPTIYEGFVYGQSATGIVFCAELQTGAIVWSKHLLELAKADQTSFEKAVSWGRSGSPLVFDQKVIVPFGGTSGTANVHSLIAFDRLDGSVLWTGGSSQIAYSSPMLFDILGVRQIVSVNEGNATGHDPESGDLLWSVPWASASNSDACASQPVQVDGNKLLLGKGYAQGSKMIELSCEPQTLPTGGRGSWHAVTVWENTRILKTKFTSAIAYADRLYGLSDGVLECVKPLDGTREWRGNRYGQGQLIIVNDRILVLAEDGRIALIPTDVFSAGKPIATMQVLDGITWNVPVVAGPYLLVRNAEEVVCLISDKE